MLPSLKTHPLSGAGDKYQAGVDNPQRVLDVQEPILRGYGGHE